MAFGAGGLAEATAAVADRQPERRSGERWTRKSFKGCSFRAVDCGGRGGKDGKCEDGLGIERVVTLSLGRRQWRWW